MVSAAQWLLNKHFISNQLKLYSPSSLQLYSALFRITVCMPENVLIVLQQQRVSSAVIAVITRVPPMVGVGLLAHVTLPVVSAQDADEFSENFSLD